ncbi:hypothetical protein [Propionivibrio sp.]|uniref:hypothetical protein n=1 Tax=Propionivibrio sp. TaxID=2212460 RepID=UPI0025EB6727|nr:hypothetical protein [Propionivibrio sp.]MBK7357172.1 hypothetical protein [Propionivibrio sp.]
MTEDEFTDSLADRIKGALLPHQVGRKQSLLYDLSFDHKGIIRMGVDPDTGVPIRGGGRGFEQDILVYDESTDGHTSVIPRIVAEIKFGKVTTHDAIVYSEKADRIRRVYPYVRYGFILGGMRNIPGRVLRLGQRFDFIVSLGEDINDDELKQFADLLREEAAASVKLAEVLFGKAKPSLFQRSLRVR